MLVSWTSLGSGLCALLPLLVVDGTSNAHIGRQAG